MRVNNASTDTGGGKRKRKTSRKKLSKIQKKPTCGKKGVFHHWKMKIIRNAHEQKRERDERRKIKKDKDAKRMKARNTGAPYPCARKYTTRKTILGPGAADKAKGGGGVAK